MSYARERDQFIAEATRHGLPLDDARALLRAATTLNRYAEVLEAQLIARLEKRIAALNKSGRVATAVDDVLGPPAWRIQTAGDPRGYVLRVIPPTWAEENAKRPEHDQRAIGVPSGPSGLKW